MRGETLLVARCLSAGPTLAAEVRRNLAVYTAQSPRHAVSALYLAGNGEAVSLQENLQGTLGIPVRLFDPLAGVEGELTPGQNRGAFAGVIGLVRAHSNGRPLPINFVAPKQAAVARDPNKRRLAVLAAIAALFLLGVVSYCYAQLAALDSEHDELITRRQNLDNQRQMLEDDANRFEALNEWWRGNIPWLDEMYNLTALLPDRDLNTFRIMEIHGELLPASRDKNEKAVAQMTLKVMATDANGPLEGLVQRLKQDPQHYEPLVKSADQPLSEPPFSRQVTLPIKVVKQAPEKYEARFEPPAAPQLPKGSRLRLPGSNVAGDASVQGVAKPQKGDNVHLLPQSNPARGAPPRPGFPGRDANAVTTPPPAPAAPSTGVSAVYSEQYQGIMEKANAQAKEAVSAQVEAQRKRVEETRKARGVSAPAPTVAPNKGKTP
jgi:hypothetical protein